MQRGTDSIALWKPASVARQGVAAGHAHGWDWARDGITVGEALEKTLLFINKV